MKNKLLSIVIVMLLMISMVAMNAYAVSFTATMTPSATTVKEATEFTITVKVSNLDVGANGINSLEGYLKYDTDVFENISESSIEGLNSWVAKFDETTGKISLTKNTFVTSTQEVFQVAFKTKSGVSGKSGNILYSDIIASNSETTISATDISTSITIGNASEGNTSNTISNISAIQTNTVSINAITSTGNNVTTNTANTTNTTNNTNQAVSSYVNTMTNTNAGTEMPNTGVDDTILKLIFVVIAVALVFYIKIERLNKDLK